MTDDVMSVLVAVAAGLAALAILQLVHLSLVRASRRLTAVGRVAARTHRPAQAVVGLAGFLTGLQVVPHQGWHGVVSQLLGFLLIGAAAWFGAATLMVVEDFALVRFRTDVADNRRARTVHTQVRLLRRVTVAIIAVLAVGAMLLTIPAARAAGASILASAGLVGIVAALAAQSVLGNVLAGLQIAFGGSLRLDDVVIVETQFGWIEEITLTYVVVQIWDDRRMILPTSYFTTKPFENWTRSSSALTGSIELDVDWTVPMTALRSRLDEVLAGTDLWDGRVCVLQVTDAVGGSIRVRALVSATNAPRLWDLRCLVREELVTWLRLGGDGIPRSRTSLSAER